MVQTDSHFATLVLIFRKPSFCTMAFRMKRTAPNDHKPEPMRKRRKLNTLFDLDDVESLSKRAEISVSKSLTADEKRIEIGKRLLAATKESVADNDEAVHKTLLNKIGEAEGTQRYRIASQLKDDAQCKVATFRGHRLSVTCMALDPTGEDGYMVSGSKDGSIIKWDLNTGERVKKVWHAWRKNKRLNKKENRPKAVLALAISVDEKWLVSGGEDSLIRVWNAQTMRYKWTFRGGHKGKVTGLAFSRDDKNTLFSTGSDRQIRVYDMNEMGFAEPLYGHTLGINSIDTTSEDRCLTVSDDKTVRYWKLRTQSQLIFNNGHDECIDACCMMTPGRFVTGSQDGSIALWSTAKKHPLHKQTNVHQNAKCNWIVSLAAKHNADVFATGSSDGICKLFAVKNNTFTHLRSIKIPKAAFINAIKWSNKGNKIICAIGTEHRLGRWQHIKGARNGIAIIKLPVTLPQSAASKKKDVIQYLTAQTSADQWTKANTKNQKKDSSVEAFVNDDQNQNSNDNDEWTSFFGNVFV
eukprot:252353_1